MDLGKFGRKVKRNWEFAVQTLVGVIFVLLVVADHYGRATLDSTITGATIVALLYFASFRLVRQSEEVATVRGELATVRKHQQMEGEIRQISGDWISKALNELLSQSDQWHFRGGSGRWQLQRVLPHLAERRDLPSRYVMQVIDPLDEHLCIRYGSYRATSRTKDDAPTLADGPVGVRRDILACIYAAGWYQMNSQVRPEITLLRSYSPLRFDVGASGLMVTTANKATPALFAAKGTWYFRSILDELEQLRNVSSYLILPLDAQLYPPSIQHVNSEHVATMLQRVKVCNPDGSEHPFAVKDCKSPLRNQDFESIAGKIRTAAA